MNFKDRVPTKPNRKKLTFEDDNTVRYAIVEYADEPTEEGTPLNKNTFEALRIVKGGYTGNGLSDGQAVNLGFRPSFVIVYAAVNISISDTGGTFLPFSVLAVDGQVGNYVTITDTGFVVRRSHLNLYNENYTYIAGRGDL